MVVTTVPTTRPITTARSLPLSLEAGGFFAARRVHFWPPAELLQERVGLAFERVGDPFAQHRRKFESVAAAAGGHHQSWAFGVGRDPKVAVPGVAVQAHPGIDDLGLG